MSLKFLGAPRNPVNCLRCLRWASISLHVISGTTRSRSGSEKRQDFKTNLPRTKISNNAISLFLFYPSLRNLSTPSAVFISLSSRSNLQPLDRRSHMIRRLFRRDPSSSRFARDQKGIPKSENLLCKDCKQSYARLNLVFFAREAIAAN